MVFFNKKYGVGLFDNIFTNKSNINEPNIIDKIDMIFTDVETEGKKKGYSRAAKEYEKVFCYIEEEYNKVKNIMENQKDIYGTKSDILIQKLEELEKKRQNLENQVEEKIEAVSKKYGISTSQVRTSIINGNIIMSSGSILDIIYRYKEKKYREAEQRGYLEAKKLYEDKINELRKKRINLKKEGYNEICGLKNMIKEILDKIIDEQMKIAELEILLQMGES
ncbi:hypothetical protein [Megamonas hypermegale]|uniref:hypothetical protein n=1 Tax=Megamonas hypermegale TaxID=158847 RepID=UPI0032083090